MYIVHDNDSANNDATQTELDGLSIAVIGMACRFPGATTVADFWDNLRNGVESITFFTEDELEINDRALLKQPNYVKAGTVLPEIESFDAHFFGLNPRDLTTMDPQQRLLLECAWEAFEDAGYDPKTFSGAAGVYTGSGMATYLLNHLLPNREFAPAPHYHVASLRDFQLFQGHEKDFLSTRISYLLNLQGPSITVQTACSTSLVTVHLACQGLLNGECDLALAGGVTIGLPQKAGYLYHDDLIFSPDGHTRTFDAAAQGTVFTNGAGLVLLKRLEDAVADGDCIHAVIRGSAINNDGALKAGYAAPSIERQAAVIAAAQAAAGVAADSITYLEAHGTATNLGDPVEIAGLTQAFRQSTPRNSYCAIGSVKTNVGHLGAAAGVAGLIKTVLALKHRMIPPSLHFTQPNPQIHFEETPFFVNRTLVDWPTDGALRRAGVSSFGLGGTNAHLILEEAPPRLAPAERSTRTHHLLTLSAKEPQALQALVMRYHDYVTAQPAVNLADLCFTSQVGRHHFNHRTAIVADSIAQLQARLQTFPAQSPGLTHGAAFSDHKIARHQAAPRQQIAFLFTGQGSQYVNMGRELYATNTLFRETLDRCEVLLQATLGRSLLELLYPTTPPTHNDLLESHPCGQAANFALECALVEVWRAWGVTPDVVLGHSLGDFAAAYTAGVLSLEDGLRLVVERGRLMETAVGSMVAVMAGEAEVQSLLAAFADVTIGVINGPASVVISGGHAGVTAATVQLQAAGFKTRPLAIPVAAHSPLLEPVLDAFEAAVRQVTLAPPHLPVVSSMTGQLVTTELTDPRYWRNHLRNTVRFADGIETLEREGTTIFLEIGPKPTLLNLAQQIIDDGDLDKSVGQLTWLTSLRQGHDDWAQLLESLGQLYVCGLPIAWPAVADGESYQRVALPTYPFQRQRFWIDAPKTTTRPVATVRPLLHRKIRLPLQQQTVFETTVSIDHLPYLTDHRVYDALVVAGGCTLAFALSSAEEVLQQATLQIEDIVWPEALIIPPDGQRMVQVVLTPAEQPSAQNCQLISFTDDDSATAITHLLARIVNSRPSAPLTIDLRQLQNRCQWQLDPEADLHQLRAAQQIAFGPAFRWVTALWCGDGEALGKLSCPATIGGLEGYVLHPALIDACFQVASVISEQTSQAKAVLMPFAVETVRIYATPPEEEWWCHAQQVGEHKWDIRLLNNLGAVRADLIGFQVRQAAGNVAQAGEIWRQWLHRTEWERLAPLDATPLRTLPVDAVVPNLIFSDATGLGAALATVLSAAGQPCVLIERGPTYRQINPRHYQLRPDAADYHQLLAAFSSPCRVIYLWGLDTPAIDTVADLDRATQVGVDAFLPLIQALLAAAPPLQALWMATCGAQAVTAADQVAGFPQALLWGMGRTIALEHPELNYRQLDLDPHTTAATQAAQLCAEILAAAATTATATSATVDAQEDQIALRGQLRYAPRLVRYIPQAERTIVYRADSSYLITGGFGGVGLVTARWLAEQGVGQLILMGRTPPSSAVEAELAALTDLGTRVTVAQADVACPAQVARVLAAIDPAYPLRGVIHAAGVLADATLHNQSAARFAQVLEPKVKGVWNLHTATRDLPLDFFVICASGAGILGNRGQANHAAANACLDSFAHYRHAQQLPALSIDWGAWGEVGAAAALPSTELQRLAAAGVKFMAPAQALSALGALLTQGSPQAAVIAANWQQYSSQRGRPSPFLVHVAPQSTLAKPRTAAVTEATNAVTLRQRLQTLPGTERSALLERYLRGVVAWVLRLPTDDQIGLHEQLFQLGIDSLMAIEVKNKIQADLRCVLRSTLLFEHPTLAALITHLEEHLVDAAVASPPHPLVKVDRTQPLPLSLAQQRLWYNQTSNRVSSNNVIAPLRLEGKLDLALLEQSLSSLIHRHELLRTRFPTVNGTPYQVIAEAMPVTLTPIDLQTLAKPAQAAAIEQLTQEEVQYVYDLAAGPLVRFVLAKLASESHLLLFSINHILIDAESLAQLIEEFARFYSDLVVGVPVALPMPSLQYADYAYWQRQTMPPAVVESRVDYWRKRLNRNRPLFELYTDWPRPAKESFRGVIIPFRMSVEQTAKLKALQLSGGATLFNSILAAWAALLYHYGQGEELVIGAPFSNRSHQELAGVIGNWTSLLLLPLEFHKRLTFAELIQQVGKATQDAMTNEVPVDQLIQALPPTCKRNNLPHQFLLSFLPGKSTPHFKLAGLTLELVEKATNMLRPDLIFMIQEEQTAAGSTLTGHWIYKIELMAHQSVVNMIEDFHDLINTVLANPDCVIRDIQLCNVNVLAANAAKPMVKPVDL